MTGQPDNRTVQVPVSRIRDTVDSTMQKHAFGILLPLQDQEFTAVVDDVTAAVAALLSQPSPTAEHVEDWTDAQPNEGPGCTCGFNGSFEDCAAQRAAEAEPPSIEDLAPGTTFVARQVGGHWLSLLRVVGGVATRDEPNILIPNLDPSTIRDVTPPKEA